MRWESSLERFEPKWEDLAQDRETWISHRHNFVLMELANCQCKNSGWVGLAPLPVLAIADLGPESCPPYLCRPPHLLFSSPSLSVLLLRPLCPVLL
eukprot:6905673-Heterocapsa_arctica.AAC.1